MDTALADAAPSLRSRRRQIAEWALFAMLLVAIVIGIRLAGLRADPVLSGSMEPSIDTGDLALVISPRLVTPGIGSVIVFDETVDGEPASVIHRVIGIETDGSFITKGDANPQADPWRVTPDEVTNVMIGRISLGWMH